MNHEPGTQTALKLDSWAPMHKGNCSCGWVSQGLCDTPAQALKSARAHAKGKAQAASDRDREARKLAIWNANTRVTASPAEIIAAALPLLAHYDLASVSWERGASVIAVFAGSGGSTVRRYILTADLSDIVACEIITPTQMLRQQ